MNAVEVDLLMSRERSAIGIGLMEGFTPADGSLAELIRGRRTVEKFQPDVPPPELVLQSIELARWAPNHKHTEPWRFHLLGPDAQQAVVELNAELVAAGKGPQAAEKKRQRWSAVPGWLAVTCAVDEDPLRAEEDYAACCCAVQNLMLFLWSEGVGTKWSTGAITRHPGFHRLLGIDDSRRVVGLIWYGYPASLPQQRRKPTEEITTILP